MAGQVWEILWKKMKRERDRGSMVEIEKRGSRLGEVSTEQRLEADDGALLKSGRKGIWVEDQARQDLGKSEQGVDERVQRLI